MVSKAGSSTASQKAVKWETEWKTQQHFSFLFKRVFFPKKCFGVVDLRSRMGIMKCVLHILNAIFSSILNPSSTHSILNTAVFFPACHTRHGQIFQINISLTRVRKRQIYPNSSLFRKKQLLGDCRQFSWERERRQWRQR